MMATQGSTGRGRSVQTQVEEMPATGETDRGSATIGSAGQAISGGSDEANMKEAPTGGVSAGSENTDRDRSNRPPNDGSTWPSRIRHVATAQLDRQKRKATQQLESVAHAIRQTTDQLADQGNTTVANITRQAADQLERFASRIDKQDLEDMWRFAQHFARRQPALFVGGAFAIGLIGARFLKSSADQSEYRTDTAGSGRQQYGYSARQTPSNRESAGSISGLTGGGPLRTEARGEFGTTSPTSRGDLSTQPVPDEAEHG